MFKSYLRVAFRNLWRRRGVSFINIMGLTVGMTAGFLIFLYVRFELSYDSFHAKAGNIYRVVADIKTPTETIHSSVSAWAVAPHTKMDFPEVQAFARVMNDNILFRKDDIRFNETESLWADSSFFRMFDYPLLKGDPDKALKEPLSVVLSVSAAKKYFGDQDPMGQTLLVTADGLPATVTGVMKDMPENSIIRGDLVVSMSTITQKFNSGLDNQWGNYSPQAFLLLTPGTDAKVLEKKFPAFLEKWSGQAMQKSKMYPTLLLEPLQDVYLRSTRNGAVTGNINNVYIFSIVAVFILLIACINFINLTTARASERAKEVGVRKVVGAGKGQLALQFTGESVLVSLVAFVCTVCLAALLLPSFNQLAGKTVSQGIFEHPWYLALLFMAAIGIGLLAGVYPAFVLSSFRSAVVLKGRFATGTKGSYLRKTLVVSQFAISTALIIGTITVYRQMEYMRNSRLGFKKDQVLVVDINGDGGGEALKQAIAGLPGVQAASLSSSVPGAGNPGAYSEIENNKGELQVANLDAYFVDFDYIPLYNIGMAAGRSFSRDFMTDTTQAMLLNEAAVKMFGYTSPEQAIGKRFKQWGREGKIVGVVKDFHFRSLQTAIKPLSIRIEPGAEYLSVSIAGNNIPAVMSAVEKEYKKVIPGRPYSYYFLDEFFNRQYAGEAQFGKLFFNFALLAIFISCLGLLGLVSYSTLQRAREIGIRKVLGASTPRILHLLSADFLKLVVIAFVIAAPVAWYFMHQWLHDFAYRAPVSWWIFVLAAAIAFVVAFSTVAFLSLRVAMTNPVKSLRTE